MRIKILSSIFYILFILNSNLLSDENSNTLKVGLLAPLSGPQSNIGNSLLYSLQLALEEINDERQSVWNMLDEIKAADVQNHKSAQYDSIEKSLARVRSLMMTKVGEA